MVVAGILFITSITPSYAYLDPGSGSMALTAILGMIAAASYTARHYMSKVGGLFRRAVREDNQKRQQQI